MSAQFVPSVWTVQVGRHEVVVERIDARLWKVLVDGKRQGTYCSESRARAAGRDEAKRRAQRR